MLKECPNKPNCVSTRSSGTQRMPQLAFVCTSQEAIRHVQQVVVDYPRAKIVQQSELYLHATFTSRLLRFVDDVEFEADEASRILHFRSASRVGYSDLGANRKRMQQITQDLLQRDVFKIS